MPSDLQVRRRAAVVSCIHEVSSAPDDDDAIIDGGFRSLQYRPCVRFRLLCFILLARVYDFPHSLQCFRRIPQGRRRDPRGLRNRVPAIVSPQSLPRSSTALEQQCGPKFPKFATDWCPSFVSVSSRLITPVISSSASSVLECFCFLVLACGLRERTHHERCVYWLKGTSYSTAL